MKAGSMEGPIRPPKNTSTTGPFMDAFKDDKNQLMKKSLFSEGNV